MIDIVDICRKTIIRLSVIDYENYCCNLSEQLIFPNKIQSKGNIKRISEQEIRLLFIEEFKKTHPELFYSIETPTENKYIFGNIYDALEMTTKGQSASIDMCILESKGKNYKRLLNIEFKHRNIQIKNIAKDILKLIGEKQNGAIIHLLDNTNRGTLCNNGQTGVLNKLYKSLVTYKGYWNDENKFILIVILSLTEKVLIHREISRVDLNNLKRIFFTHSGCGNIHEIKQNEWKILRIT